MNENLNISYSIDSKIENKIPEYKLKKYSKKTFEELIEELKKKGIKFNIITELDALNILSDLNYYYKLTVYRRNFRKDELGQYKNLEFAYLVDLASVDMQLRYLLLQSTLDIEHVLKTFLITRITNNDELDGFDIVDRFFHSTTGSSKPLNKEIILSSSKNKRHYQHKLYDANKNALSAWVLVEIMGFGDFLRFFEFYFKKYSDDSFKISSLMGSLNGVKSIRNACAHNNAFLFELSTFELKTINNDLRIYAESINISELFYKCLKVHDILSVFFIHERFVKGIGSRKYRINNFKEFISKSLQRFSYMESNNDILYFLKIVDKVLDKYVI